MRTASHEVPYIEHVEKESRLMSENGNPRIRFGMWYDFRNPPAWKRPYDQLYNEIIDQIVWGGRERL